MRLMQENLQRIHYRHMESNFQQIQSTVTEEKHQYIGSYQLKRLIISKGLRKQKLFLHRWYSNTFQPIKTIDINDNLPTLYADKKVYSYFFYKWRLSFFKRQKTVTRKKQIMTKAFDLSDKFKTMQKQYAFLIWRDKLLFRSAGVKKMS